MHMKACLASKARIGHTRRDRARPVELDPMPLDLSPLRVGIAGLGTVGAAVVRILATRREALTHIAGREIAVAAVSARDRMRQRGVDLARATWFDDPVRMASSADIDVVVELIGGEDGPAKATLEAAIAGGK